MLEFRFSYVDACQSVAGGNLRDVGFYILAQSDEPVNWFETGLDYSLGFLFREFVLLCRQYAPTGKAPRSVRCQISGNTVTISLPSGALAVSC